MLKNLNNFSVNEKKGCLKCISTYRLKKPYTSSKCLLKHSTDIEIYESPLTKSYRQTILKSSCLPSLMCPLESDCIEWRNDTEETWRKGSYPKNESGEISTK